jgi:hypothetical protein
MIAIALSPEAIEIAHNSAVWLAASQYSCLQNSRWGHLHSVRHGWLRPDQKGRRCPMPRRTKHSLHPRLPSLHRTRT